MAQVWADTSSRGCKMQSRGRKSKDGSQLQVQGLDRVCWLVDIPYASATLQQRRSQSKPLFARVGRRCFPRDAFFLL